jgi:PAS domain S-box-containing protein
MRSAALPANETERLARLRNIGVLDSLPQQAFDDITALAASICGTPIALISLVDEDRQWFKSRLGLNAPQTSREVAFCSHAILQPNDVMVVPDARADERFQGNPLVEQDPSIRFYAGAPIVTDDGLALGTVCVIDTQVRELSAMQRDSLKLLSNLVNKLMEHFELQREQARRESAAMQRRNQMFEALLTSGSDLKSFVDLDYRYQFVNPMYLEYWNRQPEDIIGRHVAELTGEQVFDRTIRPYLDRALAGERVTYEATFEFPSLGQRHMEVAYLPARNAEGEILGVVVRVLDRQQRKQDEDELNETLRLLERRTLEQERFIHIVSHDLREPINSINNFAGLLATDPAIAWPGKTRRYLEFVHNGGQRMERLLDDLLEFVRLDSQAAKPQPVDLNHLVAEVRADLHLALERSSGQLRVDPLPTVWCDPTLLRIALQNLVSNALKFVRPDSAPDVCIAHRIDGESLCLTVRDNGIGIAPDKLNAVFDMFKRLHDKRQYAGTGLGLSICRRIAQLHGGSISVSSTPGEGSCFTLRLPLIPLLADTKEST